MSILNGQMKQAMDVGQGGFCMEDNSKNCCLKFTLGFYILNLDIFCRITCSGLIGVDAHGKPDTQT
jgi:hypothetical protein